jgi:hypothetical protein
LTSRNVLRMARAWLIEQGHELVCAICGKPENGPQLCVDHDHESGKLRGFLCHQCNIGIGMFGDSPGRLAAAADYLRRMGT